MSVQTPEPCRIYEYDGAWKCYAHNRVWGAITGAGEPCPGWNESAGLHASDEGGE